jgi:hypothetical protein
VADLPAHEQNVHGAQKKRPPLRALVRVSGRIMTRWKRSQSNRYLDKRQVKSGDAWRQGDSRKTLEKGSEVSPVS